MLQNDEVRRSFAKASFARHSFRKSEGGIS
jgi:hypothetical protein